MTYYEEKRLPDSFYDWLDECPVSWFRMNVEETFVEYGFNVSTEILCNPEKESDE